MEPSSSNQTQKHQQFLLFDRLDTLRVKAMYLAEQINTRALKTESQIASMPLMIPVAESGCAVVFRYGAVVLFDVDPTQEKGFLEEILTHAVQPFPTPTFEEVTLLIQPKFKEGLQNDALALNDFSLERLQLIAHVLAKSTVLDHYETKVAASFDVIEPLTAALERGGKGSPRTKVLLKQIGGALLSLHKTLGRAEVGEKPELLWDRPQLERLYAQLAEEYELRERQLTLDRKVNLISGTAQTMLDLVQTKSGLRVEWYIAILIVAEILLTLYEMFFRG